MKQSSRPRKSSKQKRGVWRRPPGRPAGTSKPFANDADRFALAAMVCAVDGFGLGPYQAADRVILLFSNEPLDLRSIDGLAVGVSVRLPLNPRSRAETVVAKYRKLRGNLGPVDLDWLASSAAALGLLVGTIAKPDPARMHCALEMLAAYGWEPTLEHICGRIEDAFRTNMPPADAPLSRALKAMLAELRKNS
jgi:hypothetical protein